LVGDAELPQPFPRFELAINDCFAQLIFHPVAYLLGGFLVVWIHSNVQKICTSRNNILDMILTQTRNFVKGTLAKCYLKLKSEPLAAEK
jgi:hypothetical protein